MKHGNLPKFTSSRLLLTFHNSKTLKQRKKLQTILLVQDELCILNGCSHHVYKESYCKGHYTDWIEGNTAQNIISAVKHKNCSLYGCTEKKYINELCMRHSQIWKQQFPDISAEEFIQMENKKEYDALAYIDMGKIMLDTPEFTVTHIAYHSQKSNIYDIFSKKDNKHQTLTCSMLDVFLFLNQCD